MFNRRTLILSIAALILVSIASYLLLTESQKRNPVLVAKRNIEKGEVLGEEDVIEKSIMTRDVLPNALRSKKDALGKVVLFDRVVGDQITKEVVGEELLKEYKEISKKGNVIFALNISYQDGISQIIKKGDIISIIRTKASKSPYTAQSSESENVISGTNMVVADKIPVIDILEKDEKRGSILVSGERYGLTILIEIPRKIAEDLAVLEASKAYKVVLESGD
ncbi:MAG: SAF domain-containing protein [Actinomycetota bacterium]